MQGYLHKTFRHAKGDDVGDFAGAVVVEDEVIGIPVGEQYIDLVPPAEGPAAAALRNGARIGQDRTAIGQDIAGLLDQAQSLVNSVSNSRIRDLLRSAFEGFNGSGQELARMIASSRQLIDEANANFDATSALVDQVEPFLDAQIRSGDDIRKLARSLAAVTTEVAPLLARLRRLIEDHDTAAVDCLNSLRQALGERPSASEALHRLEIGIAAYDFEQARKELDALNQVLAPREFELPRSK